MTWQEWYVEWIKKDATISALKSLDKLGGEGLLITKQRIAIACFNAAHYNQNLDPGEIYRKGIATEKRRLKTLQKAARVLAESSERNDKAFMWAHLFAESKSGVRITRKEHDEPMAQHLVMENYFSHLEAALKDKLPELHGGQWLHRITKGNLVFNQAIKGGAKVKVETMLAFELAIYLRMHTAGRANSPVSSGIMHCKKNKKRSSVANGEPCYPVIAAFCNAVFDLKLDRDGNPIDFDAKLIGDNVCKLKGVLLQEWPTG